MFYDWISITGIGFAFLWCISSVKIVTGMGLYNTLIKIREEGGDIETGWQTIFTTPDDSERFKEKRTSRGHILAF
jgi:hypothetical protein